MNQQILLIVYDGACPFCTAYLSILRLRESMHVELLSARSNDERIEKFIVLGYRLDDWLLAQLDGVIYIGADAVHQLAAISNRFGTFNRIQRLVFAKRWVARVVYPLLRFGRRLVLLVLRIPSIENLLNERV